MRFTIRNIDLYVGDIEFDARDENVARSLAHSFLREAVIEALRENAESLVGEMEEVGA